MEWIQLYLLWMLLAGQLFSYCLLGTIVELMAWIRNISTYADLSYTYIVYIFYLQTDNLRDAIASSDWHLLPIKQQLYFVLMMLRSQEPTVLMVGTMPLNMITFVSVSFSRHF